MSEFLYQYHPVEPATWFYLSSLLTIGLYFKFSRLWSIRNLDLVLLILLAPGLLFVHYGRKLDMVTATPSTVYDHRDEGLIQGVVNPATDVAPPTALETNSSGAEDADPRNATSAARPEDSPTGTPASPADGADGPNARKVTAADTSTPDGAQEGLPLSDASPTSDPSVGRDASLDTGNPGVLPSGSEPTAEGGIPEGDPVVIERTRGKRFQKIGYLWLFATGAMLLVRVLADPTMVRRPLLEPNLSVGGLTFIGCSLFVFLMANVISRPAEVASTESQSQDADVASSRIGGDGPGHVSILNLSSFQRKTLAVAAHLGIVIGMMLVGYRHFDNILMGIGAGALYLMLPYNALMTNEVKHVLPSACLVWAVLCYRRPLAAGTFLGLAGGMAYYPLFLLPLWFSFYWARGLLRFSIGLASALIFLLIVLYFHSDNLAMNFRLMFGLIAPAMDGLRGIWDKSLGGWHPYYRYPVLAAFLVLVSSMALWPAQKNLGTLLSCSSAVMIATQFWHGYGGGMYMAWYLPLLLLTVFRPNLEDRVALMVVSQNWLPKRLTRTIPEKAAA